MESTVEFPFEALIPVVFFAVFALIVGLVIYSAIQQAKKAAQNLATLAERLGLQAKEAPVRLAFFSMPPELYGTVRGRRVRVYSYTTGSGKQRTRWCAVSAEADNPGKLTLKLSAENILTRAGRAVGFDDVTVGDEAFDRHFYLKSNDPAYVRAAFIPELRTSLLTAWKSGAGGSITVEGGEVRYAEVGQFSGAKTVARFEELAQRVCDIADMVEVRGIAPR